MTQFSPRSQLINKNKATDSSRASKFTQINCFGYNYFGFPRKVEFMMDAGKLAYLWILTDKVEEEELKKLLAAKTGGIEKETANYIWFSGGKVALRKDVPEVLVVADKYRDLFEY